MVRVLHNNINALTVYIDEDPYYDLRQYQQQFVEIFTNHFIHSVLFTKVLTKTRFLRRANYDCL